MSRLPLRVRLALVFALAMAVVLTAVGAVLYLSVREALDGQIAENAVDRIEASEDATRRSLTTPHAPARGRAGRAAACVARRLLARRRRPAPGRGDARRRRDLRRHLGRRLPLPPAHDEVRRLSETLNAMLGRLEEGLERERRFVADAGHELRTPLATLRAELELALRQPRPSEELVAALRSAAEEVERLVRLAEDLLVLAREGEDRPPLRRTRVDVSDLLAAVAARFRRGDRSIEVAVPEGLVLDADRARLEQALGNLVENALRHGGGTVRLQADAGQGEVVFRVQDEGGFSHPGSPTAPSSASAAPTRRGPARARGSARRSSPPSPARTAAGSRSRAPR